MNIFSVNGMTSSKSPIFKTKIMNDAVSGATCGLIGITIFDPILMHHKFPNMAAKEIFSRSAKNFGIGSLILLGITGGALLLDKYLYNKWSTAAKK